MPRRGRTALVLLLPLLALGFLLTVWPTLWQRTQYQGQAVRINRLTREVQFFTNNRGWATFGSGNRAGVNQSPSHPTKSELAKVTLENIQVLHGLPNGNVRGRARNPLPHALVGDVVFHLRITRKTGDPSDRELRGSVNWPALQTTDFELRTGLAITPDDTLTIDLRPAPAR